MSACSPKDHVDARNLWPEPAGRQLFARSDQKIHLTYNMDQSGIDIFTLLAPWAKSAESEQSLGRKNIRNLQPVSQLLVLPELSCREFLRVSLPTHLAVASIRLALLEFRVRRNHERNEPLMHPGSRWFGRARIERRGANVIEVRPAAQADVCSNRAFGPGRNGIQERPTDLRECLPGGRAERFDLGAIEFCTEAISSTTAVLSLPTAPESLWALWGLCYFETQRENPSRITLFRNLNLAERLAPRRTPSITGIIRSRSADYKPNC